MYIFVFITIINGIIIIVCVDNDNNCLKMFIVDEVIQSFRNI